MAPSIPDENDVRAQLAAEAIRGMQLLSRRVRREARVELEPLGLTVGQVRALHELGRHVDHDHRPGIRMGVLADALDVVPRSATDVVEALEAHGLVARSPDPADGRAVVVALTDAGFDLLSLLARRRRAAALEVLDALSTDDLRRLDDLVTRALDAI